MGIPVVASNVGGIYALIQDGSSGLLVQPKQPQELAEAIVRLLKDEQFRQEISQRASQQAVTAFNLTRMVDGIEQVYNTVLNKG